MLKSLAWFIILFTLWCRVRCHEIKPGNDDDESDIESIDEDDQLEVDPLSEMEKGDFYDDYPEHEPVYQPFNENYEAEQAQQEAIRKSKIKNGKSNENVDENIVHLHNAEDFFSEKFKKPEIQLDGMADHEPVYQPEDPGDEADLPPDHKDFSDDNKIVGIKETLKDDRAVRFDKKSSTDSNLSSHSEGDHFDYDNHEPIYQPEDQDMNAIPHDEL